MKYIDLHTHTNFSDGVVSLEYSLNELRLEGELLNARFDKLYDTLCEAIDQDEAAQAPMQQEITLNNEEI